MNVRLLRRIQKQILKEPRQFYMDTWFKEAAWKGKKNPNCGTAACIGGWAIALSLSITPREASGFTAPEKRAMEALKLTSRQADLLFQPNWWPRKFRRRASTNPQQAIARIEHFIRTKGNE